ncbi:hypothetical protein [Maridesulfovibrio ferrireducens]|uniref:hypothetical protein n=1 Tax=Maridesulfovibrio ferrireducens TaxID=246191 RepID=UPI001A2EBF76|nr:hypothetical protein [Maridesulfovibrio ferrireducens]MBI9112806.1 hypothetical protein [Maridesulfovibrio ferrireducens]
MKESSTDTLVALYPLENRGLLKSYAKFVEGNPDWLEFGFSLSDYKRNKSVPELKGWEHPDFVEVTEVRI